METKMIAVNVTTCDESGNVINALSIDNCPPQQLSSILSLCKKDYVVTVAFREADISHVMYPNSKN